MRQKSTSLKVQDDYLDCFGTPEQIGKIGTDIQDNKCSWLVNKVLTQGTEEQRELLKQHYGRADADSVAIVKEIYAAVGVEAMFKTYEEETYKEILARIEVSGKGLDEMSRNKGKQIYLDFLKRIYKRDK